LTDFNIADLRTWRRKYNISQEKFAKLANLGINTILKIESGKHKVQVQTQDKILQAIKNIESESKVSTPPPPVAIKPTVAAPVEKSETVTPKPTGQYSPIVLSNLDLELIHRILLMNAREKLHLLEKLMG